MKRQQFKTIFTATTILTLLLLTNDIYARAGGGGGSGKGEGTIIGLIIWGIYTAIITVILLFKTNKSDYILRWAFKQDIIWDSNKMKTLSKSMFFKMQEAWMNRNMDTVKDFISEGLYADYKQQLDIMLRNEEVNILESIYVSDIKIISCEDFNDNSKDSFIAYIKGSIVDFTISEKTGRIIKNKIREKEKFKDTYHFVRQGNKWLLNYIDNDVTISDLISAKNYKEK